MAQFRMQRHNERDVGQESVYKVVKYKKWTVALRKDAQDSVRKMSADAARIPRQISRARLEKSSILPNATAHFFYTAYMNRQSV